MQGNISSEPRRQMYDTVVTWGTAHFPAWKRKDGNTLVDLRIFPANSPNTTTQTIYRPDELIKAGVPAEIVKAAAESNPPGFVLL